MVKTQKEKDTIQTHNNLFRISENTWKETVNNYFNLSNRKLSNYLQWYPFTKKNMYEELVSDEFYNQNIRHGNFLFDHQAIKVSQNYIQKSDGTYRQAQLLSPVLLLVLEAICKEIFDEIDGTLTNSHALYAGNLSENNVAYSKQYDLFYKEVNKLAGVYPYYMKFDISNFFRDIDINILFSMIEERTNKFSQFHIYIYKKLFEFLGQGKFPIIENSTGLSYLATKIYLEDIDKKVNDFLIEQKIPFFEIIRYVDDLYIFFDNKNIDINVDKFFSKFKSYYATNLRDLNLNMNIKKSEIRESKDINESLKMSFYQGETYDERINLHEISFIEYQLFLKKLVEVLEETGTISLNEYNSIKNQCFDWPDIELSVEEAYNTIIFKFSKEFKNNPKIINLLNKLLEDEVITFDVKRFVVATLHTKDEELIKNLLNIMFKKNYWSDSDNYIAITYLLQRSFVHDNLKNKLKLNLENRNQSLYKYIETYCEDTISWKRSDKYIFIENVQKYKITTTTLHLYFLYIKAELDDDILISHAYFKTFFDRITAELDTYFKKSGKVYYNKYYEKSDLTKVYKEFKNGREIIKEAQHIRHANPVVHSSSELAKGSRTKEQLEKSIRDLKGLINALIKKYEQLENDI